MSPEVSHDESVNHPSHYGGDTDYEVIKVLEAWDLNLAKGFCWGNLIKYTARAGQKGSEVEDRLKAQWYADRLTTITARLEVQGEQAARAREHHHPFATECTEFCPDIRVHDFKDKE